MRKIRKSMSEEFSFRDRGGSSGAIRIAKRWKRGSTVVRDVLARCQKSLEELELARLWHFLLMKEFLASQRVDLARFRAEIYRV